MSDDEAVDALHTALTTAVDRCLVADVPVGAYLSGGLDSSVVVALMQRSAQRGTGPIATFAAGFGDERHDELPWARQVSDLFGTEHHEVHVGTDDFLELWEPLTWHRDAPVSEPSDIAVHRLAQLAAQHVKVVLSGEGADELFAGYPKHRYAALTRLAGRVPHGARIALLNPLQRALPPRLARPRIALRALSERTEQERLSAWFAPFLRPEIAELLGANHTADRPLHELRTDPLDSMLAADVATWLPDNLLERGDRMSMAASLELRPPFLDVDVVELAFAMPAALKVRNGQGKWALRRLASRYLPTAVLERPKVGFRVPMDAWFRTGLRELARERLTDPSSLAVELFDRRVVEQLLRDHETARRNEEQRIWTLLSLEVWNSVCRRGGFSSAPPATIGGGLTCQTR
jgi:asparagine synthase (glutamine-hydrolysing)